jgi:hypothetical protein
MKKLWLTIFAAAALALPLCAQVGNPVRVDIPFAFAVENTTAAPGTYVVTSQFGSVVLLAGSRSYYLQTSPIGPSTSPQGPKLVFHRYGNRYFLAQIWTGSRSGNFPMSRVERELTKTAAAAGQTQTEIVLAMR